MYVKKKGEKKHMPFVLQFITELKCSSISSVLQNTAGKTDYTEMNFECMEGCTG